MGIGKVAVECLRDAVSNRTLLGRVEARQDSQQITEEFTANEVVVNETVVLLARKGSVAADAGVLGSTRVTAPCGPRRNGCH